MHVDKPIIQVQPSKRTHILPNKPVHTIGTFKGSILLIPMLYIYISKTSIHFSSSLTFWLERKKVRENNDGQQVFLLVCLLLLLHFFKLCSTKPWQDQEADRATEPSPKGQDARKFRHRHQPFWSEWNWIWSWEL